MPPSENKRDYGQGVESPWPKPPSSVSSFTAEEEQVLSKDIRATYGFSSTDELLNFCFEKKFVGLCHTPQRVRHDIQLYSSEKWTNQELHEFHVLKTKLNKVKNKLNHYDLNEWHRHTRATNPADLVMRRLKNEMRVEFLTQAWCKFYELVAEFNLIPRDAKTSKKLYSVHLCEAPGAFVASFNHYLKLNHPNIEWHWKANSLNPFYEGNTLSQMINDDRFMMQTLSNWNFGPDQTGDITHPDYPDSLADRCCGNSLVHLVTADGSFDCQDNPDEQEGTVSWLHVKETLAALRVLKPGGHFVIKMFTFFECETICLLYLLRTLFESLNVMKPATSKEGNSEVYVVCREFKGAAIAEPYLEQLYSIKEEEHRKFAMFSYRQVDRRFLSTVLECAKMFVQKQISVIERNIRLFDSRHDEKLQHQFEFVQWKLWLKFVNKYGVEPIPLSDNIVPMTHRHYEVRRRRSVMERREHRRGSYAEQLKRKSLPDDEVFAKMSEELYELEHLTHIKENRMPRVAIPIEDLNVALCKPIETVRSSQFCHGTLIRIRSEVIDTITIGKYNELSQHQRRYHDVERSYRRVCDFRKIFSDINNYTEAQLQAFYMIYETLQELRNNDDLVLIGFPLLTQFNINVLCFLQQIFDDVELKDPFTLYLHNLDLKKTEKWGPKLDNIIRGYSKNRAVLSFLPLDHLTSGPLYSWLVDANNARVYQEIRQAINSITQPKFIP